MKPFRFLSFFLNIFSTKSYKYVLFSSILFYIMDELSVELQCVGIFYILNSNSSLYGRF